ncbi:hypothetical protein H6P81_015469 [Aristolochia fimbriata]|uniref:Uncharacterized protein n=1 Tax=Aristolochia fimbriata TaxID=158543 RepID=A0AAV7E7H7_ARIFI|nr:hypothetical protein H6P81_015469 [Aristolochia fimbriata]
MKLGFQQKNVDSSPSQSLDGSFRRSKCGISPDRRSEISNSSRFYPSSRRAFKGLKEYSKKLVDLDLFSQDLEDWVLEKTCPNSTNRKNLLKSPFPIDDLRKLDYALEGISFQQLFRMPYSMYASDDLKEDEFLALEDFLHAIIEGLWRTFWHRSGPIPFLVSCPRHPGSKFYTVEGAIAKGRLGSLCGAAIVARTNGTSDVHVQWDQLVELALFKSDISEGNDLGFSAATICESLFYGFHILLSRSLSKYCSVSSDCVYLLVLDAKFGGVIKFGGDLSKLEINSSNPYHSVAEWIKHHAEINVSPVDRIWNKLGNPNWGDLGTLQILLATFYSIIQWKGPPRKSIASLAADHSLRLQKRRVECGLIGNGYGGLVPHRVSSQKHGEIVELDGDEDQKSFRKHPSRLKLKRGEIMMLEDADGQEKGFQIQDTLNEGNCLSYSAVSLDHPDELLTVYVGSHPSRLEPSWEDMSMWYQVQRQTKVLNVMKAQGVSSKCLPEIIASGRILHSGPCKKQNPGDRCDHPWCGTPILVTCPVGEQLSSIVARSGPFSSEEALRCCRDCLSALRSVSLANIQHGDLCPENIIRVDTAGGRFLYMPVSWGRAVLEDKDSPAINLQFSSTNALQQGKLCPVSDAESLIYLLYFISGGPMQQQDSIESALQWRERSWARRLIQLHLGEVSALLKAFADYVDSLSGTPYPVDYDIWLKRLNLVIDGSDRGKLVQEMPVSVKLEDVAESSGTSGCSASVSYSDQMQP